MALQPDIQYIRFYTDGSAAREAVSVPREHTARRQRPKKQKQMVIYIDPVAILGIVAAVCLLVMMAVGLVHYYQAQQQLQAMEEYVQQLEQENHQLQELYRASYDLEEIRRVAEALGMVPKEQMDSVLLQIPTPPPQPEPDIWEKLQTFLTGLFA